MKASARYAKIVEWSEEDQCYVGSSPGLLYGGCHGDNETEVFEELIEIVEETISIYESEGRPLPPLTSGVGRTPLTRMYTSTFTFAKGQYDDEFHALDSVIAQVAKSIPGYLGEEAWENHETGLISNVYYWESMEALQALMKHPSHIQAKQHQSRWLNGYQVVVAQVIGTYGDGGITHPLSGKAAAPKSSWTS